MASALRSTAVSAAEALERRQFLSASVSVGAEIPLEGDEVDMAPDGSFVVAWGGPEVSARRYSAAGVPLGAAFQVNTYTTGSQGSPSVAIDDDGDFVVVWSSESQDGSSQGIYAQRYSASGVPQGGEFLVNTYTPGAQTYPRVAIDSNGGFVIVWDSELQDGSSLGVYGQCYSATGVPQGGEFRVNQYTTGAQAYPAVAMDADGDFLVTWQSDGQDGDGRGVYARRFLRTGSPMSDEFLVNSSTLGHQDGQLVEMSANGNAVIAWNHFYWPPNDGGLEMAIYGRQYNAEGVAQGAQFPIDGGTGPRLRGLSMNTAGAFIVAWGDDLGFPASQDGYTSQYVRRFDSSGTPLEPPQGIYGTPGNLDAYPTVAMDADGDYLVTVFRYAWQGGPHGTGQWEGVGTVAQRYAVVPEVDSSALLFDSSPHRLRFNFSRDVRDSLTVDDLLVQNLSTGLTIPSNQFALLYDGASDVATFMYMGSSSDGIGGVLPDGNYRATLGAAGVVTPAGAHLGEDHVFEFSFLNGDANSDARVDSDDFNILANNFGRSGTNFAAGDFTFDGTTDSDDFDILAGRFGVAIGTSPSAIQRGINVPIARADRSVSLAEQVQQALAASNGT